VFLLVFASSASAATQIGEAVDPTDGGVCAPSDRTFLQTGPAQYVIPSSGVLTSWSYQAAADPPQLKFKVAWIATGIQYLIVGESELQSPASNSLNTYGTRIQLRRAA
jgi:hypothetical protein